MAPRPPVRARGGNNGYGFPPWAAQRVRGVALPQRMQGFVHTPDFSVPRQQYWLTRLGSINCPMASRRAAELATGAWRKILRHLLRLASASLLLIPAIASLLEPDKASILEDWNHAKTYINLMMSYKMSFWRQLPWICFSLAAMDEDLARHYIRLALALYQTESRKHVQRIWFVYLLLDAASPGFVQLQEWLAGRSSEGEWDL